MSALPLYGSLVLIVLSSAVVGQATLTLCGWRRWSGVSPAVGVGVLILVAGLAIRLPGEGAAAAVVAVALTVASLVLLWRRRPVGLRDLVRDGLPVVVLATLAASLPFAAAGRFGELGVLLNNDLGIHLQNAEWLRTEIGPQPTQVAYGYPVGPHGVVIAVAELAGASLTEAFTALLMAVPVLAALAALEVLGDRPAALRAFAATLVGVPYLAASFYVQSAFKETLMALFVLAFALLLRALAGEGRRGDGDDRDRAAAGAPTGTVRGGVPLALIAGASVQTFSYPGAVWPVATAALWAIAIVALHGGTRAPRAAMARAWPQLRPLAVGGAIVVLVTVPALARISNFIEAQEGSFGGTFGQTALGNVFVSLPPEEVTGIWFSSDLRFAPPGDAVAAIFALVGVLALGVAAVRLVRRRELALVAALVGAGAIYLGTRVLSSPYVQSKALAIASPLVMLCVLTALLPPGRRIRELGTRLRAAAAGSRRAVATAAIGALGAAFIGAAAFSSYLALGGATVGPELRTEELRELEPTFQGRDVVFLGFGDDYSDYALGPARSLAHAVHARDPFAAPGRFDFDSPLPAVLDNAELVIAPRSPFSSEPPAGFRAVESSDHFTVWERSGPSPPRRTLNEAPEPGTTLDCDTARGRRLERRAGTAHVFAAPPVVGPAGAWSAASSPPRIPGEGAAQARIRVVPRGMIPIDDGVRPTQTLRLPPGSWEISIQYQSADPLTVDAPGLHAELPPVIDPPGPFWPVGSVRVRSAGPVPFEVAVDRPGPLRRLLRGPDELRTRHESTIGAIAATRPGSRRAVALADACGRYVDWYRPG